MGNLYRVGLAGIVEGRVKFVNSGSIQIIGGDCLSLSDWASLRIKVNNKGIVYKFKRDGKKIERVFPMDEYTKTTGLKYQRSTVTKDHSLIFN